MLDVESRCGEMILWCALKYALCLEEKDATEAVIETMKAQIPYMSDGLLNRSLVAIKTYIKECGQIDCTGAFIHEWNYMMKRLLKENMRRCFEAEMDYEG